MLHIVKGKKVKKKALLWLRRDLRWHDHIPLAKAMDSGAEVQPVFVFDSNILARFNNKRDCRISFIVDALKDMQSQLRKHGKGKIILAYGKPQEIIPALVKAMQADLVYAGRDFEPECIQRDTEIKHLLQQEGVLFELLTDHLLLDPTRVLKSDGSPFKIFTPYSRVWRSNLQDSDYIYADSSKLGMLIDSSVLCNTLPNFQWLDINNSADVILNSCGYEYNPHPNWPVTGAELRLETFVDCCLGEYATKRNFPALENGTSRLSPYLRFGRLSIRECYRAILREKLVSHSKALGAQCWENELIWRDFYAMILYHNPSSQYQELLPQYRNLVWRKEKGLWRRFVNAETGYPIIDAAIKQLYALNWMHNRCRMIVASFLTKHLLIDWRLGEEWFAHHLMDYELASNVGGWQWAASTGADAQPYFRVFNPVLQSKKFDPDGDYIKAYLPQLRNLDIRSIHEPWTKPSVKPDFYPGPIVDHKEARLRALALFKNISN